MTCFPAQTAAILCLLATPAIGQPRLHFEVSVDSDDPLTTAVLDRVRKEISLRSEFVVTLPASIAKKTGKARREALKKAQIQSYQVRLSVMSFSLLDSREANTLHASLHIRLFGEDTKGQMAFVSDGHASARSATSDAARDRDKAYLRKLVITHAVRTALDDTRSKLLPKRRGKKRSRLAVN